MKEKLLHTVNVLNPNLRFFSFWITKVRINQFHIEELGMKYLLGVMGFIVSFVGFIFASELKHD